MLILRAFGAGTHLAVRDESQHIPRIFPLHLESVGCHLQLTCLLHAFEHVLSRRLMSRQIYPEADQDIHLTPLKVVCLMDSLLRLQISPTIWLYVLAL